jgi:hypothetical protein
MQSRRSSKAEEIVRDGFGHETNVEIGDVEKTRGAVATLRQIDPNSR